MLVSAPAPATAGSGNDDFADAMAIGYGDVYADNSAATVEPGEPLPSCTVTGPDGMGAERSVWYLFTAPEDATVAFDTTMSIAADTEVAVYTGSTLDSLTEVGCSEDLNDEGSFRSRVVLATTQGTAYHVQVTTWTDGTGHQLPGLQLTVGPWVPPPPAPGNDTVPLAVDLGPGQLIATTVDARTDGDDLLAEQYTGCQVRDTVWYRYTPTENGTAVVDLADSGFDTALGYLVIDPMYAGIYSGGCNEDAGPGLATSRLELPVRVGRTYFFQVGSTVGQEGDLSLDFTAPPPDADVAVSGRVAKAPGARIRYDVSLRTTGEGSSVGGQLTVTVPKGGVAGVRTSGLDCTGVRTLVCTVGPLDADSRPGLSVLLVPGSAGPLRMHASYVSDATPAAFSRAAARPTAPGLDDPANNATLVRATSAVICDNRPTRGTDRVVGGRGDDILCGLDGRDTLEGRGGDDVLFGGDQSDVVKGGDGRDHLYGGGADDLLVGGSGRDWLDGGDSTDVCRDRRDTRHACEG